MESQTGFKVPILVDRNTGEVLPGPEHFVHCELGARAIIGGKPVFHRNVIAHGEEDIKSWRDRYNNTGIFRTLLLSNEEEYLDKYGDEDTLFYAPLTFDMDANKDPSDENWTALVHETRRLVNYLVGRFKLPGDDCINVWFSGGRGFHIEVPPQVLGIYPHHQLNKIFNRAAREAGDYCELEHLDLSLYGGKHLYRLEGSIHERTKSYKWPMKASELAKAYDYSFISKISKEYRVASFWKYPNPGVETTRRWDQLVLESTTSYSSTALPSIQNTPETYNRSDFRCIEMQFEKDYIVPEGNRYNIAYILAMHLYQNGFDKESAESEMMTWASEHCSPPYTSEEDLVEWHRMLDDVYHGKKHSIGCPYIQTTVPSICEEKQCPIGQRMIKKRQRLTLSQI